MTELFNQNARYILTREDEDDIKQAILNAELDTSGEIRVHVESICPGDVVKRASAVFYQLNIHETKMRNGVLFFVALRSRKFAIIPDVGIKQVAPDHFWDDLKMDMLDYFREDQFAEGLIHGIGKTAGYLKKHFPYINGDKNELPDEVSYG